MPLKKIMQNLTDKQQVNHARLLLNLENFYNFYMNWKLEFCPSLYTGADRINTSIFYPALFILSVTDNGPSLFSYAIFHSRTRIPA